MYIVPLLFSLSEDLIIDQAKKPYLCQNKEKKDTKYEKVFSIRVVGCWFSNSNYTTTGKRIYSCR